MIKVLVFDTRCSAIIIGNYIEQELPIKVQVVIDNDKRCREVPITEIGALIAMKLEPYIGDVDVVVLTNPEIAINALRHLRRTFPEKKFVYYGQDLADVIREKGRAMILTSRKVRAAEEYQWVKAMCQDVEIRELDAEKWAWLIRENKPDLVERLRAEIDGFVGERLIINSAELLPVESRLKCILGWRAEVVDLRQGIVDALRESLGMNNTVGRPRKSRQEIIYERLPRATVAQRPRL